MTSVGVETGRAPDAQFRACVSSTFLYLISPLRLGLCPPHPQIPILLFPSPDSSANLLLYLKHPLGEPPWDPSEATGLGFAPLSKVILDSWVICNTAVLQYTTHPAFVLFPFY